MTDAFLLSTRQKNYNIICKGSQHYIYINQENSSNAVRLCLLKTSPVEAAEIFTCGGTIEPSYGNGLGWYAF